MATHKILSVIILTYNQDEVTVVHAREAMLSNRTPDEVIVVDDGGVIGLKDKLQAMYDKSDKRCPLIYARIEQDILWNYTGAFNLGTWISRGDYLAYEDNDNIPTREVYDEMIKGLEAYPEVGRVCANKRMRIYKETALTKPFEEWKEEKEGIGPNMGTNIIRREVILKLKGQDERFSGGYGWMYVTFRRQMLNQVKTKFGMAGYYWYIMDDQTDLPHNSRRSNLSLSREICNMNALHSPYGILNFTYTVDYLK